jgi:hypothetical protein
MSAHPCDSAYALSELSTLWSVPSARHRPRSVRHGNGVLSRLYFVGYVTVYPRHCANVSTAFARLSPTPIAQRRSQVALRGTAPPSSSCFVQMHQDARYLPEYVKGASCELRPNGVLGSSRPEIATWHTKIDHMGDAPSTSGLLTWGWYVTRRG